MPAIPDEPARASQLEQDLVEARRELRALRSRLEISAAERDLAVSRLQAERELSERYRHQLIGLRNSTSWRITRPMRKFRRKIFRGGEF